MYEHAEKPRLAHLRLPSECTSGHARYFGPQHRKTSTPTPPRALDAHNRLGNLTHPTAKVTCYTKTPAFKLMPLSHQSCVLTAS